MKIKFKKLNKNATSPKYAKDGDAAMDLTITEIEFEKDKDFIDIASVKFGLALEIPEGYVGLLFPRSSIYKNHCMLVNSVGVLDSSFRGEIMAKFFANEKEFGYKVGDRAIQLIVIPIPLMEFEEVKELTETDRSTGGFGSTGN